MDIKNINNQQLGWVKIALIGLALLPCVGLLFGAISSDLGANPIENVTKTTGYWTLTLLMITLSVTPLRRLSGWNWLVRLRRILGLSAFFYGCLHFLTYMVLDQFFDWDSIIKDIIKRPYITVGFPSFLLMVPLALSSRDSAIKKLGGKNWRRLHRLSYVTAIGGVVHYWWLVKKDLTNPITFAVILLVLLGFRIYWIAKEQRKSTLS